jgi:hypothetical protein
MNHGVRTPPRGRVRESLPLWLVGGLQWGLQRVTREKLGGSANRCRALCSGKRICDIRLEGTDRDNAGQLEDQQEKDNSKDEGGYRGQSLELPIHVVSLAVKV